MLVHIEGDLLYMSHLHSAWPEFVSNETLFANAIRLRQLLWTIQERTPLGSRLLEVGFGSGTTAALLADIGYHVTAIDISEELVETVRGRYSELIRAGSLRVEQGDMLNLRWRKQEFDLIYHQGVLEHFPDEQIVKALEEQARVANQVILDVPNSRYGQRPFGDERLLPIGHWRKLISRAGLEIRDVLGRGFPAWAHVLPYGFFTRRGARGFPFLTRWLGAVSIFVCRSKG